MSDPLSPDTPDAEPDAQGREFVRRFLEEADLRHLIGIRGMASALIQGWDKFDEPDRREIVQIISNQAELLWPPLNDLRQEAKRLGGNAALPREGARPGLPVAVRQMPGAEDLPLPTYKTGGAAGMDLYAAVDAPRTLAPGQRDAVPTGIAIAVPPGYEAQVRARSGLARHYGIALVNAPGTIDCDYRGEIAALIVNLGSEPVTISRGERIAQLIVAPYVRVEWQPTDELEQTERGGGGFGHTGR